jgi:hypothetical protein
MVIKAAKKLTGWFRRAVRSTSDNGRFIRENLNLRAVRDRIGYSLPPMNFSALLYGIGAIGPFSSRVFLPALLTALLIRFGGHLPLVGHLGLLAHFHSAPAWFTSDPALIALTILSVLEVLAQKNPEARQFLHEFDIYLKPAVAVLSLLGVLKATDASFLQATVHAASYADVLTLITTAVGVLRVASVRRDVVRLFFDHIEGTHLDHLISWAEDAGSLAGMLFVVLFPIVALVLLAIATGFLFLLRRRVETAEEERKIACPHCGKLIYPSACACPACNTALPSPCAIGFLGGSLTGVPDDPTSHAYRLVEKRRCPVCASRLAPRQPFAPCPACGTRPFADPTFADAYISHVTARLPGVLIVCFLIGLIPLLGLIIGVVYYRIALVLPFAQYLSLKSRFLLRWGLRILLLILIFFQIIPVLGALTVPLLALLNFIAYRTSFQSAMQAREAVPQEISRSAEAPA